MWRRQWRFIFRMWASGNWCHGLVCHSCCHAPRKQIRDYFCTHSLIVKWIAKYIDSPKSVWCLVSSAHNFILAATEWISRSGCWISLDMAHVTTSCVQRLTVDLSAHIKMHFSPCFGCGHVDDWWHGITSSLFFVLLFLRLAISCNPHTRSCVLIIVNLRIYWQFYGIFWDSEDCEDGAE